ncbi:hypothetical protein E2C01_092755 [Portunus trituberculatus]|uniref:Uncharacterized protein n=1 Tax=Portunus trituberculatus TaxID=210409 RepID=A0A5B7JRG2_PORTR|nr:hypothetical protein [Portunus trituberculatus]
MDGPDSSSRERCWVCGQRRRNTSLTSPNNEALNKQAPLLQKKGIKTQRRGRFERKGHGQDEKDEGKGAIHEKGDEKGRHIMEK